MEVLIFDSDEYKITISTEKLRYVWDRFFDRVKNDSFTYCNYTSTKEGHLYLIDPKHWSDDLSLINRDASRNNWNNIWPIAFDTCEYQVAIEFKNLYNTDDFYHRPSIKHEIKGFNKAFNFYPNGKQQGLLVGNINFLNSPGKFSLCFVYHDSNAISHTEIFTFYVASPKLDTKRDLNEILKVINQEYENYIFNYLTLTFSSFQLNNDSPQTDLIWFSIFKSVIKEYIRSVKFIFFHLNRKPYKKTIYSRPDHIRIWSQHEEERFVDFGKDADMYRYRNVLIEHTIDTKENRFVKYSLISLIRQLKQVFSNIESLYPDIDEQEKAEIESILKALISFKSNPDFKRVGEFEGFRQLSYILQQRNGYYQVYKCWIMLKSSLNLINGKTNIGVKKIWELYEIWCFIVMKKLIAKILNIDDVIHSPNVTEAPRGMIDSFIDTNKYHCVLFYDNVSQKKVKLEYQKEFNHSSRPIFSLTTIQKPDIVLTITTPDNYEFTYLYDAKYRVMDSIEDGANPIANKCDYPVPDAINQMHRYRDSIYYAEDQELKTISKAIVGGYILFPGRSNEFTNPEYGYLRSISTINIGAFPVIPCKSDSDNQYIECDLLEKHLRKIINENSDEHLNDCIPQKGLQYKKS